VNTALLSLAFLAATANGSICIAPVTDAMRAEEHHGERAHAPTDTRIFSVQIDGGKRLVVPSRAPSLLRGFKTPVKHAVTIRDGDRVVESFRFNFADRGGPRLCLHWDPFYETWRLDLPQGRPWCHCR